MIHVRRRVAVVLGAAAVFVAAAGPAGAQYFLRYTGDGASRRIRDALTVVTQAEQSIDTGHGTLGGWLFLASEGMIQDAADSLPDSDAVWEVGAARHWLEKKNAAKAARALNRTGNELRRFAGVWDVGEAEPNCAALLALTETGDCPAALAGIGALAGGARMNPVRALLEQAGERVAAAGDNLARGRSFEALKNAGDAKGKLRAALLGMRLSQAKILVAHARLMAGKGSRFRARWTLGRASRRLARAGALADAGGADAAGKIRADIDAARQALRGSADVWVPLTQIEAKIVALIEKCCRG
jgi:hypothetical protein